LQLVRLRQPLKRHRQPLKSRRPVQRWRGLPRLRRPPAIAPTVAKQASNTAINRGTDAPYPQAILLYRQRAETGATTKPTRSAGRPECFWPGDNMKSGGIAAACTPRASFPGRSFRSPKSNDQDVADAFSSREPVPVPHQVRDRLLLENAPAGTPTINPQR
jgi:hypothetical protein